MLKYILNGKIIEIAYPYTFTHEGREYTNPELWVAENENGDCVSSLDRHLKYVPVGGEWVWFDC